MRTMVNIEINMSDYMKVRDTMKHWATWLEDSVNPYDQEARETILMTLKAIEDSAEIINYKD